MHICRLSMFPIHIQENGRLLYLFHGLLVSINDDRLNLELKISRQNDPSYFTVIR